MNEISIIPYAPEYQPDFERLNVAWISAMFAVEEHDLEQLQHPETHILPNHGAIFLAKRGDEIVGTVAMVNTSDDLTKVTSFELAKMSVTPAAQGLGIGKLLALAAIDYARQIGAKMVWLESNRKAAAALILYERVGFQEVPLRPSLYTRADVCMELYL